MITTISEKQLIEAFLEARKKHREGQEERERCKRALMRAEDNLPTLKAAYDDAESRMLESFDEPTKGG